MNLDVLKMSREELERAFIRNVFLNEDNRYFIDSISSNYFTTYKAEIDTVIKLYKKNKLDILNISEANQNLFNIITNNDNYDALDIENIYGELVNKNNKNVIFAELEKIKKELFTKDAEELLVDLENIRNKTVMLAKEKEIKDSVSGAVDRLMNPVAKKVLKTGIKNIDDIIYGMQPNNYVVIGGRPGGGKTALALQIAENNMQFGKKVLYVSLEMDADDIVERMLLTQSRSSKKDFAEAGTGNINPAKMTQICNGIGKTGEMQMIVIDDVDDHKGIIQRIKSNILKNNIDLVIIDYIGLIKPSAKSYSREREVAEISRDLKLLTKNYKVPIICLTQLNRDASEGEPTSASIRESDSLLNDANKVLLLWKDETELQDGVSLLNCKVVKNREGDIGKTQLVFEKTIQRITSLEKGASDENKRRN